MYKIIKPGKPIEKTTTCYCCGCEFVFTIDELRKIDYEEPFVGWKTVLCCPCCRAGITWERIMGEK